MSTSSSDPFAALPVLSFGELLSAPAADVRWLWEGYLAAGKMTLLTSQWKMGKTTLLSVLLAKMRAGGELAGQRVAPARAALVTEEPPDYWAERGRRLGLGPDQWLLSQPFRGKPTPDEWRLLIGLLGRLRAEKGLDLVAIDPLATFLPGRDENNAGVMLAALLPLKELTAAGAAVLVLHHPSKRAAPEGQAARGSGALSAHADILLELRPDPHGGDADRRRRLLGLSRFRQTPRQAVIELNAEGTDYRWLGDVAEEAYRGSWEVLRTVLLGASGRMTRHEILADWPAVEVKPDEKTLWRWLERAVAEGKVLRKGTGLRNSPFRYWLPEAERRWKKSSFYVGDLPDLDEMDGVDNGAEPLLPPGLRPREGKDG
ncbi:MAG TPA: AAA family ATPase [Gemmataceae bacterium]|nr:AAA family ATPase [Gemmataceae bacterium]